MRTRWLAVAAVLALAVGGRAEDKKADNKARLVGTWEVVKADKGTLPVGATFSFTKDGNLKVAVLLDGQEKTDNATYSVEGDKLKFNEKTLTIKKLSDDALVLERDGKSVEFKRIKK